jgi:hypothetical protein
MGLIDKLGVLTREKCRFTLRIKYGHQNISIREKCRFTLRIKYGHQNISIKYFYDLSIISRT